MKAEDRVVLAEGLDLGGKTILCEGLASKLREIGWEVVLAKNNLLGENAVGKKAKQHSVGESTDLEAGLLFLASHFYDTTLFRLPEDGVVHLQDSSWLRTISYNTMRETPIVPELADALFEAHPKFGTVIYLTASIEARQKRLMKREAAKPGTNTPGDFLSFTDPEFVARHDRKLLEITQKFYPYVHVIDTSTMDEEEVIRRGWEAISSKITNRTT